ncbi:nephrin-like [Hermetia illucens]|uniref:nephrin-like n=1 Tax=Hermetia illucens TaxID=343691 RepID=UPI0018CC42CF|nr:nephrin-like [Hermetia illucens]
MRVKCYVNAVLHATIFSLVFQFQLICTAHGENRIERERTVRTIDIEAVEGKKISLPCPLVAPSRDKVYMVLWFRDDAGIPLYSFDVRGKPLVQGKHWSAPEIFGNRAKFNADLDPAALELDNIKRHDQGIYRCRVDFRTSQTQSFRYNVTVIIPPEHPIVLDRWGRQLNETMLGPLEEGDDLMLTCRVIGGRPQPEVRWLVNGLNVDNQCEYNSENILENRLLWPAVQRTDLNSIFTCQVLNTQLISPKEANLVLDLHLKPLTAEITNPPPSLVADRRYEVTCESTGSRPNAIITWYKGKRQLRRTKDDTFYNTTVSKLSFVPSIEDNGKSITCRAENPNVTGLFLETVWKLNVVYPPLVALRLGSTLSADDIKEGDDVYFECQVQANPQWRKLNWLHDGVVLTHNTSARIIRSNQSLVLQRVTRESSGNYSCSAINAEGETVSNQFVLKVKYIPFCKTDSIIVVGALHGERIRVGCTVEAYPPPRSFRWKFNNSGETMDVSTEKFYKNGSLSILEFAPVKHEDYGTLSCWAQNSVGIQQKPCLFQIILAGLPSALKNCTMTNNTQYLLEVQCHPGNDGGLPQIFVLRIMSTMTGKLLYNLTNIDEPYFAIDSIDAMTSADLLSANFRIVVFAVNQKGKGPDVVLKNVRFHERTQNFSEPSISNFDISPIISGVVLVLIILSCLILGQVFVRRRHQTKNKQNTNNYIQSNNLLCNQDGNTKNSSPRWQHSEASAAKQLVPGRESFEDECDPDVIPAQFALEEAVAPFKEDWCSNPLFNKFNSHHNRPTNLLLKSITHENPERDRLFETYLQSTVNIPASSGKELDVHAIKTMLMTTRVPESCV